MTLKTIGHLFDTTLLFVYHFKAIVELKLELLSRNAQFASMSEFFCPLWPWNLMKKKTIGQLFYGTLNLCIISKLSMNSNWSYSPETLHSVKIGVICPVCSFDRWPWKIIGHLSNATSSFVHYFIVIIEFKLELQSGNAQFGSKSTIVLAVGPLNLTDDHEKQ